MERNSTKQRQAGTVYLPQDDPTLRKKKLHTHILLVRIAIVDRSRTAQDFLSEQFAAFNFLSAGIDEEAIIKYNTQFLEQRMIDEADEIVVMEDDHREWIRNNRKANNNKTRMLNIPDKHTYYSNELKEGLQKKCRFLN